MIAQEATHGLQTGKWYQFTTYARSVEFERHLKPFKGDVFGSIGGGFAGFEGGAKNA